MKSNNDAYTQSVQIIKTLAEDWYREIIELYRGKSISRSGLFWIGLADSIKMEKEYNKNFPMTINQYDANDNLVRMHTGTFRQILSRIKNYDNYYYRITSLNTDTLRNKVKGRHFNVAVACVGGLSLTIEDYINNHLNRTIQDYKKGKDNSYDFWHILNRYIFVLDRLLQLEQNKEEIIENEINSLLSMYDFKQVLDLNEMHNVSGIYMLVLDSYNTCYIGQASKSIKTRIMRHWSRNDYFTGNGIDLFRAYDTTRIFVLPCNEKSLNKYEHEIIEKTKPDYVLNTFAGGTADYLLSNNMDLLMQPGVFDVNYYDYDSISIFRQVDAIKHLFVVGN